MMGGESRTYLAQMITHFIVQEKPPLVMAYPETLSDNMFGTPESFYTQNVRLKAYEDQEYCALYQTRLGLKLMLHEAHLYSENLDPQIMIKTYVEISRPTFSILDILSF